VEKGGSQTGYDIFVKLPGGGGGGGGLGVSGERDMFLKSKQCQGRLHKGGIIVYTLSKKKGTNIVT